MGGRGGASGLSNKNAAALPKDAKEITIETYYRKSRRYYGTSVLEARETSDGNISFAYAEADFVDGYSKANTQNVVFRIKHGAEKHNNTIHFHGIDWDNVKSVSGKTYDIKSELSSMGFRWDGEKYVKK